MTLKRQYIQVADKKDYFLSCNFKWESQARQSLRLRTFLFGSVTACEKSTTRKVNNCERHHTQLTPTGPPLTHSDFSFLLRVTACAPHVMWLFPFLHVPTPTVSLCDQVALRGLFYILFTTPFKIIRHVVKGLEVPLYNAPIIWMMECIWRRTGE